MEKDMTAGTPGKIIFNFTMPIFIGNIFQQFYNMADTVIVGKFVGNAALAAVGACGTLVFLIIGFLQLRRDLRLLQHSTSEPET